MTNRLLLPVLVPMCLFLSACNKSQTPAPLQKPAAVRQRRLEGYPLRVINAHNDYATKVRTGRRSLTGFESVISTTRTWDPRATITVAFQGGNPELRSQIVDAVTPWMQASGAKFDFQSGGVFREWTNSDAAYAADVRIAFLAGENGGYWSAVGRDGVNPSLFKPNEPSMNLEGFTDSLPPDYKGVVLHEFGHALGFEHEHQNPNANCEAEFRWQDDPGYVQTQDSYQQFIPDSSGRRPGIYTRLEGPLNNWSQSQIDFNLRKLAFQADLLSTAIDKKSIMLYHFDPWMYVDPNTAQCYTPQENTVLSQGDTDAVAKEYPQDPVVAKATVDIQKKAVRQILDNPGLTAAIRSHYTKQLQSLANAR